MGKAYSRRQATYNQQNSLPSLVNLAKDVDELAISEKQVFGPILKKWHPFAAGVAVATLHACYRDELKQFMLGITMLSPDVVHVLRAADRLEKNLVQIAVEDSAESDDGGKEIIREMRPFEAEFAIATLVKDWIKERIDRMRESADRSLEKEVCHNIIFESMFPQYYMTFALPAWLFIYFI